MLATPFFPALDASIAVNRCGNWASATPPHSFGGPTTVETDSPLDDTSYASVRLPLDLARSIARQK